VSDLYSIPGLTEAEKAVLKKYDSKLITLEPAPEYTIDRINNGLYR
jgi:photosystem II PsbU protein